MIRLIKRTCVTKLNYPVGFCNWNEMCLLWGRNWIRNTSYIKPLKFLSWLTRSVTGFSTRMRGFDFRSVHMRFVIDKLARGQEFLRALLFPPCQCHSTNAQHSSSSSKAAHKTTKERATQVDFPTEVIRFQKSGASRNKSRTNSFLLQAVRNWLETLQATRKKFVIHSM